MILKTTFLCKNLVIFLELLLNVYLRKNRGKKKYIWKKNPLNGIVNEILVQQRKNAHIFRCLNMTES